MPQLTVLPNEKSYCRLNDDVGAIRIRSLLLD